MGESIIATQTRQCRDWEGGSVSDVGSVGSRLSQAHSSAQASTWNDKYILRMKIWNSFQEKKELLPNKKEVVSVNMMAVYCAEREQNHSNVELQINISEEILNLGSSVRPLMLVAVIVTATVTNN